MSSTLAPDSRFSNTAETGIRVSRNTHAPFNLPGTLSTAGHCDQSRVAIVRFPFSPRVPPLRPAAPPGEKKYEDPNGILFRPEAVKEERRKETEKKVKHKKGA